MKFDIGFNSFNELIEELEIDTKQVEIALKKAGEKIKKAVKDGTPVKTGKLKKGVKLKISKKSGKVRMSVQFDDKTFWDLFNEFGTSKQRKNIGFFSRAVSGVETEAFNTLKDNIFKK